MRRLQEFIDEQLEHTNNAKDASTAADIKRAILDFGSATPKKEVGLRLARKGFQEDTVHHDVGPRRTTKRVYRYKNARRYWYGCVEICTDVIVTRISRQVLLCYVLACALVLDGYMDTYPPSGFCFLRAYLMVLCTVLLVQATFVN